MGELHHVLLCVCACFTLCTGLTRSSECVIGIVFYGSVCENGTNRVESYQMVVK
jgi:hypothetical protein